MFVVGRRRSVTGPADVLHGAGGRIGALWRRLMDTEGLASPHTCCMWLPFCFILQCSGLQSGSKGAGADPSMHERSADRQVRDCTPFQNRRADFPPPAGSFAVWLRLKCSYTPQILIKQSNKLKLISEQQETTLVDHSEVLTLTSGEHRSPYGWWSDRIRARWTLCRVRQRPCDPLCAGSVLCRSLHRARFRVSRAGLRELCLLAFNQSMQTSEPASGAWSRWSPRAIGRCLL
jgi:hypothetical protein